MKRKIDKYVSHSLGEYCVWLSFFPKTIVEFFDDSKRLYPRSLNKMQPTLACPKTLVLERLVNSSEVITTFLLNTYWHDVEGQTVTHDMHALKRTVQVVNLLNSLTMHSQKCILQCSSYWMCKHIATISIISKPAQLDSCYVFFL